MKNSSKRLAVVVAGLLTAGIVQAGDMDSAVAYSMGEFDRVGASQPTLNVQTAERAGAQKQSAQERQLAARKAEFVRRMFWLALAAR